MRLLFITRNFPPQIGGLENFSFFLYSNLSKHLKVDLVKWNKSKKWLVIAFPYLLVKSLLILLCKQIDIIYLTDGAISPLLWFLRIFKKPIYITIHGLDITYNSKLYQKVIPKSVRLADKIICVSRATRKECLQKNISPLKLQVVPNGINDIFFINKPKKETKRCLEKTFKISIKNKQILLSVGRLIERKGIHLFIKNTLPLVLNKHPNLLYIIAGKGKMKKTINHLIRKKKLKDKVLLLDEINQEQLKLLYNSANIFIMPNIPVENDMEGFGIVAIEAASCKLPVIASDIEGIKDALLEGKAGILIPPQKHRLFTNEIINLISNETQRGKIGKQARKLILNNFSWNKVTREYLIIFKNQNEFLLTPNL